MNLFLFWVAGILVLLACYLAYLWWHPRKRSRFQVRLTATFLLFTLVPCVPLIFIASTLATGTADILLVPEVEGAMMQAAAALKTQFETTATRFMQAVKTERLTSELLQKWQIDYLVIWCNEQNNIQLVTATGRDTAAHQHGLTFGLDRVKEVWGQIGSQVEPVNAASGNGGNSVTGHCRVWLPSGENEMALIGFGIAPEIVAAKEQLTRTMRLYNSLSLIKERTLQDQLIWGTAAAIIFVLSLLSVLMARAISRRISRPLEHLGAVTAQVAAGNLQVQAQTPAKDEIRQLVDSFNHMIRELAANREKLIVAERLAAWREVARQVSHEIKNPLTPIQLALYRVRQRLGEALLGQEAVRESLQSIEEELASLRHLADEFSEFARLPRAALKADHLNEIIQLTARLHEGTTRNVQVKLDLASELPARPLDREQIKRLLNNLIKNAIEAASNRPCEITISTRKDEGRIRMIFSDNGPGLPQEMVGKIFIPNFTTKRGGSGLGLVIVKRILEEHGGMITVESTMGKGTRFSIVI